MEKTETMIENLKKYLREHTKEQVKSDMDKIMEDTKDIDSPTVGEYLQFIHTHGHGFHHHLDILGSLFDKQTEENARLREEIHRLKEGIFEKEEMKRLKERYDEMSEDYNRGFPISDREKKLIDEFIANHPGHYGAIGGGFTYQFVPTGIGTSGKIIAMNGDELEFQEIG